MDMKKIFMIVAMLLAVTGIAHAGHFLTYSQSYRLNPG